MECPHCGLINPETAQRCDCGYDFTTKTLEEPYDRSQEDQAQENGNGRPMKNVFRIGFIILWVFVLFFIWPRFFPEAEGTFSFLQVVVGGLLAPFWAGIGSHIGEQIEKRYGTKGASNSAAQSVDPRLAGIRGWLILPAIYLVLATITTAVGLIESLGVFSSVADAGYRGLFALLEWLVLLAYLVVILYAATRFFSKKRNAPSAMIGFWIAAVVGDALINVIELAAGAEEFPVERLLGGIINAAIWISYFRLSKRVKATFVRDGNGTVGSASDPEERGQDHHQVSTQGESTRKRSRAFAIASLSLGLISLPSILLPFGPSLALPVGILFAVFGIIFGILQVTRHRSGRVLACSGMALSLVGLGLGSLMVYGHYFLDTSHETILTRMGYVRSVIDNPIPIELFRAVEQPSAQWYYSGAVAPLGWYSGDQQGEIPIEIPLAGSGPTEAVSFDPGDSMFGFFMRLDGVYEWYTESAKNSDRESHVKVYPTIIDGREIPNSYLICWEDYPLDAEISWEDYPLDAGSSRFVDFTDLIVRVDGVRPAAAGGDDSVP